MITVWAGGSSRVLRKACGVASVILSAPSTMKTFTGASSGRSAATRSSSRMSSTRRAGAPLGLDSGGVGSTRCTSGCAPRAMRAAARAAAPSVPRSVRLTSAAANACAAALQPDPAGPTNA